MKSTLDATAVKETQTAKDASSASNLHARKAQIIGFRHPTPRTPMTPVPTSRTPVKASAVDSVTSRAATAKTTNAAVDLGRIRKEVMELLEKYDNDILDRIDTIMEEFKGKEEFLNLQRRSEMVLQRRNDRMQKKLMQQQPQKKNLGNKVAATGK